ncbi:MAG: hypothetical protein ACRD90_04795, partial [Nitrosopumilaceae archaeon]
TDIEVGPDGLMYVVSRSHDSIYRIIPKSMMIQTDTGTDYAQPTIFPVEYAYAIIALIIASIVIYLAKTRKRK